MNSTKAKFPTITPIESIYMKYNIVYMYFVHECTDCYYFSKRSNAMLQNYISNELWAITPTLAY